MPPCYRARLLLEVGGVTAVQDAAAEALAALRELLARWQAAVDARDTAAIVELHLEFRAGLVRLVGSPRLDATYKSLIADLKLALATVDRTIDNVAAHFGSHQALLRLLEVRDTEACSAELARHLELAQANVLAHGRLRTADDA